MRSFAKTLAVALLAAAPAASGAAVSVAQPWSAVASGTPGTQVWEPPSLSIQPPTASSRRLLVVAVSVRLSQASATFTVSGASYGGVALSTYTQTAATSSTMKTWIGYAMESTIADTATNGTALAIKISTSAGTTITDGVISAGFYANVDQVTPFSAGRSEIGSATSITFGSDIGYSGGGAVVYALGVARDTTDTPPAGYTHPLHTAAGAGMCLDIGHRLPFNAAGAEPSTTSVSYGAVDAASALSVVAVRPAAIFIDDSTGSTYSVVPGSAMPIDQIRIRSTDASGPIVATVTVRLTNHAALTSVFLSPGWNCGGIYGAPAAPAETITLTGVNFLAAPPGQTVYVCGTAAVVDVSTTVTAVVTSATTSTAGYEVVNGDVAGTMTVTRGTVYVADAEDLLAGVPASSITVNQTRAINGFSLRADGNTTASSVTLTMTNPEALTSVFLYSRGDCQAGGQWGYAVRPATSVTFSNVNISVTNRYESQVVWVCGTAATVTTTTPVTTVVASVTAAAGFDVVDHPSGGDQNWTIDVLPTPVTIRTGIDTADTAIAGEGGRLDTFTVQTTTAGASFDLTSVTVNLAAGAAALTDLFIASQESCDPRSTVGALENPVAGENVVLASIRVTDVETSFYVCGTAANVSQSVTVTGVVTGAAGLVASVTDTNGTLTVNPPSITIGDGSGEANTTAIAGARGRLDVFTLALTSGSSARLDTIRVHVTEGAAALSDLFITSSSTPDCSGPGTLYGTLANPADGPNDVPVWLTISGSPSTYYVCGTAAGVGTSSVVRGNVASVAPAGTVTDNDSSTNTLTVFPVAVTVGNGSAEPASSSVTSGQSGAIDAFSVRTTAGSAQLTSVTVDLPSGNALLTGLFISASPSCKGAPYGTLTGALAPTGNVVALSTPIPVTPTSETTNLYVCGTAATVGANAEVTARVSSVARAVVTSADTTSGTLTVTPPVIAIGNGSAEPPSIAIFPTQAGPIDAFTVRAEAGAASLTTVTVQLTGGDAALASLFVSSSPTCDGTTYGTLSSGIVAGANTIALTTPIVATTASATNLYVCGTAANAEADTAVTGNVAAVGPGTVTDGDTTNATLTVRKRIPPTTTGTIAATVNACNQITISASYMGDTDADSTVAFTRSTDGTSFEPFGACASVGGSATPRVCVDRTVAQSTSYWYRAQFSDPGGVFGTNPLTISARATTGACAPNLRLASGLEPAGGTLTAGAPWTYVGQLYLSTESRTVTLRSIAVENVGAGKPASAGDLQLYLTNAAGTALYSRARWDGVKWVFEPIADPSTGVLISVGTTEVTFRVYATATYGAAPGETFAMRIGAANVVGLAPCMATTGETVTGNSFTTAPPEVDEGSPTDGSSPMVSIVNPEKGTLVSGDFLVQVYVYSGDGSPIAAKGLSTSGTAPTCATDDMTLARDAHAYSNARAAMYSKVVTGLAAGTYTLKACARNGAGTIVSAPVKITVRNAGSGDGNLLVRDNSSQLCSDCHAHKAHSSETLLSQSTGVSDTGSWATTCRDCHTPHGTRNAYLVKEVIVPPAVAGYQPAKEVRFAKRTGDSNVSGLTNYASSSFVNSDNTGPCQVCHTRTGGGTPRWRNTGNADTDHYGATSSDGTARCTSCHSHARGFAALESKGNEHCRSCHGKTADKMAGSAGTKLAVAPKPSRHSLVGFKDTPDDTGGDWASVTNLSDISPSSRSCVNMCHQDHVHNQPAGTTHDFNVHANASTQAARQVTRSAGGSITAGTPAQADFTAGAAPNGMCVSCHQKPVAANRPAISGAAYDVSAHDYVSNTAGATYDWRYSLHDGSTFDRNCTKCHASRAEGNTPRSGGKITAVHGTDDPFLLAGDSAQAGSLVCYNCHGAGVPEDGAQGDRSGKDLQTPFSKAVRRPIASTDGRHDSGAERSAAWNDRHFSGENRHAACADCHDPHRAAGATRLAGPWPPTALPVASTRNAIPAGSALTGATGIAYGAAAGKPYPALWNASKAENFGASLVQATREYEICFKCHTSFAFGTSGPPTISSWYSAGKATFTNGSHTVTGPSANWPDVTGMWIRRVGEETSYQIIARPSPAELTITPAYAGTTAASPQEYAIGVGTDLAMEFSPSNRSGHPVVTGLENYSGSVTVPEWMADGHRGLNPAQLTWPWSGKADSSAGTGVGHQTMTCSDCHNTEASDAVVQGPHGSGVKFMLSGVNQQWPMQANGIVLWTLDSSNRSQGYGTPNGLFCFNCHPIGGGNSVHTQSKHQAPFPAIACVICHSVIPHGGKVSRLIVTKNAPAPYNYYAGQNNPNQLTWFRKKNRDSYAPGWSSPPDCGTSCVGVHAKLPAPGDESAETW